MSYLTLKLRKNYFFAPYSTFFRGLLSSWVFLPTPPSSTDSLSSTAFWNPLVQTVPFPLPDPRSSGPRIRVPKTDSLKPIQWRRLPFESFHSHLSRQDSFQVQVPSTSQRNGSIKTPKGLSSIGSGRNVHEILVRWSLKDRDRESKTYIFYSFNFSH